MNSKKLKKVISTVPTYDDNLHLLKTIKEINPDVTVIVTAQRISEANSLYDHGADYVITPKISAGHEVTSLIGSSKSSIKEAKNNHIKKLKDIHKLLYK